MYTANCFTLLDHFGVIEGDLGQDSSQLGGKAANKKWMSL